METKSAFIRSDGIVELNPVTAVHMNFAIVINPAELECEDTVRFNDPVDDVGSFKLRIFIVNLFNRFQNFANCLKILNFTRVFFLQVIHDFL